MKHLSLLAIVLACGSPAFASGNVTLKKSGVIKGTIAHGGLGNATAISGNTILLGAPGELGNGAHGLVHAGGAAHVYVRNGTSWSFQAKLQTSMAEMSDGMGASVAIDGDTAVVGIPGRSPGGVYRAGAVYVSTRAGFIWGPGIELAASDSAVGNQFGSAVAISGDTLVVANVWGTGVYVFIRSGTNWTEGTKILNPGGVASSFGNALALRAGTLVVGDAIFSERVHVYVGSGANWSHQISLTGSDTVLGDGFGSSVAIDQGRILVGAPGDRTLFNGIYSGSAYVFVSSGGTWTEESKLTAADTLEEDWFGYSVALSGDTAVLGAFKDDHLGSPNGGSAYVFRRGPSGWSEEFKLTSPSPVSSGYFGKSVSVSGTGTDILVGAPRSDPGLAFGAGEVHSYQIGYVSNLATYCTGGTSASGCVAKIGASGGASATVSNGFVLSVSGVEGGKNGIFLFGWSGRQAAPWGNGTSFRCVVPPTKKSSLLHGIGNRGVCDGSFAYDLNAHWYGKPGHNPGQGAVVQAQLWFRDPQNTSNQTTSFSDAIEFCVGP